MTTYEIVGIGNAVVDVISHGDDSFLEMMGIEKGIMQLVEKERGEVLYGGMTNRVQAPGGSVANTLAGLGAACVVVGTCLLISDRLKAMGILQLLVPAGRQTLTLYIAHVLVGMGTLDALGMLGGRTVAQAVGAALLFSLVATLYALIWARWFKRGPVEALMRRLAG